MKAKGCRVGSQPQVALCSCFCLFNSPVACYLVFTMYPQSIMRIRLWSSLKKQLHRGHGYVLFIITAHNGSPSSCFFICVCFYHARPISIGSRIGWWQEYFSV